MDEPHIQSHEHVAIKQEDIDDRPGAICESHPDQNTEIGLEDEFNEASPDDLRTPDGPDGRDEPIRSIEEYDEIHAVIDASSSLRGGSHIREDSDDAEEDGIDDDDNGELEPQINMDDYYESEDDFEAEYDVDGEDLTGYRVERTKVKDIASWPREVARAHKTLALRGTYSLMPSSWNWDLMDHPFVDGLFAPPVSDKKILFQEQTNRFRGM